MRIEDCKVGKQFVWKETFESYEKCEDYLEYWIDTYGVTDEVVSFTITKVFDNTWKLVILYS